MVEASRVCRPSIALEPSGSGTGKRRDDAGRSGDHANLVTVPIGDVEVVGAVESDAKRESEVGAGGRAAVTACIGRRETSLSGDAGIGGNVAGVGIDATDDEVLRIRN